MQINNYINLDKNDYLSKLNYKDIDMLLSIIKDYKINYRETLNINKNTTFGLEFEVCSNNQNDKDKLINLLIKYNKNNLNNSWYFDIEKVPFCTEFVSCILKDNTKTWEDIKNVCDIFKDENAFTNDYTGGHIHFGTQIFGNNKKSWINFIKLWAIYENIIYRFSYGEYVKERNSITTCAHPISSLYLSLYNSLLINDYNLSEIIKKMNVLYKCNAVHIYRYNKLEYGNNNTIEIRCPNASINEIIWQNNINFFYHLLNYCNSNNFNDEILNKRIYDILGMQNDLSLYKELFIEQALELSDLIFTSNLDKINFLRQYIKDSESNKCFRKSKKFTK